MKVLITGGTGFIGQHLIQKCVSLGWETHVLLRSSSKLALSIPQDKIKVHIHDGQINSLVNILQQSQVEGVIHLATYFCAEHKIEDVAPLIESNLLFGTQLLHAMSETKTQLLINTGTAWQHFNNENYNPVSLYAATKQAFIDVLKFFTETKRVRAITLKIFDTYGPGDERKKIVPFLLSQAKRTYLKESLSALELSAGEQKINFLYIDDVVDAFIFAMEYLKKNPSITHADFAIKSDENLSLKAFINLFQKVTGVEFPTVFGKKPYREREVMEPWSAGENLPGWTPRVSLAEGLQKVWKNYVSI